MSKGKGPTPRRRDFSRDPEFKGWAARVAASLPAKIADSTMVMSLFPGDGEADVKFAVELGFSIMMNKPLVFVMREDQELPPKLAQIADHIIRWNGDYEDEAAMAGMQEALKAVSMAYTSDDDEE